MDLGGLTNWLQTQMAHIRGGQPFRGQDGVMYGPAVERASRVPIRYDSRPAVNPQGGSVAGYYDPGNLLHPKVINIYPNSALTLKDVNTTPTVEHEGVHAVQDNAHQLNTGDTIPGYDSMVKALTGSVAGDLSAEAPANAISYDPKFTPNLPRSLADSYGKATIAASPAAQQPALQQLYTSARDRLDANDATLAAKAKQ